MSDTSGGSQSQGYYGQRGLTDALSRFHTIWFHIKQSLAEVRTSHPIKILKITGGGVGPPPIVDIQLLVKQADGVGNSSSHTTIYSRPVMRIQGGKNAIICDPAVGDIGHAVISDRDTSSVEANAGEANPGSFRRHHPSDAVYHGAILNKATPNNYIDINGHIHILSASDVTITDSKGNTVVMNSGGLFVSPGSGLNVYLGATSASGCFPVVTTGGDSTNVFAKV